MPSFFPFVGGGNYLSKVIQLFPSDAIQPITQCTESWIDYLWMILKGFEINTFHHFLFNGVVWDVSVEAAARNQTSVVLQLYFCNTRLTRWSTEDLCMYKRSEMYWTQIITSVLLLSFARGHGTQVQLLLTLLRNLLVWHSSRLWTRHSFWLSGSSSKLFVPVILFKVCIA